MEDHTVEDLAATVESGDVLAFGGKTIHRAPMAFVRAIARRSVDDLTAIGLAKAVDVDLLCATGQLSSVYYGYVGLEWLGLAPNFRRAVESGQVTPHEGSCYTVATMFRGAIQGVPSLPVRGMDGSDLPGTDTDTFATTTCPFSGEELLTVRTVKPDIAVVHAVIADRAGNAVLPGGDLTENLIARAADRVYVTAERIVDRAPLDTDMVDDSTLPQHVRISGALVDAVAAAPYGAHPTSCPDRYEYDRSFLRRYREIGDSGTVESHRDEVIGRTEAEYRERIPRDRLRWDAASAGDATDRTGAHDPEPDRAVTVAEIMCVSLARRVVDGGYRTVFQGFASPLPTVAIRVAREQRPEIVHLSASGAVNGCPSTMPSSTEDQHLFEGASGALSSPECFDMAARGELDVMFVGSPQIDRQGRLNGSVVGSWDDPRVKFPGAGGTASLLPLIGHGFAWRTEHSPRTLPESVDFVTAAGNLSVLVTPLCTFERREGELVVVSIHPGVDRATIQERTGWSVTFADPVRTPPPSAMELELLDRVDPSRTRRSGFSPDQLERAVAPDIEG